MMRPGAHLKRTKTLHRKPTITVKLDFLYSQPGGFVLTFGGLDFFWLVALRRCDGMMHPQRFLAGNVSCDDEQVTFE